VTLTLVDRGVRALAEQLNRYYRVLKGVDADSIALRLTSGGIGQFVVRHSVTNADLFRVTDTTVTVPPGTIAGAGLADGAVTSAKIADQTIVDADVSPTAAISVTKLAHVGAGNVLKSGGSANAAGQVVNADVAPAAAISVTKLAHVGAGNVVRSDGSQNVAGQVVTGDIANGTIMDADINSAAAIDGSKLADASVPSSKIMGGATIPANSIDASHIIDGSIMNAEINTAAAIAVTKLAAGAAKTVLTGGSPNSFSGAPVLSGNVGIEGALTVGTGVSAPASGNVKLLGSLFPSNQATASMRVPVASFSAASASPALVIANTVTGLVVVINHSDGTTGIFTISAAYNVTALIAGPAAAFDIVASLNNKINLIYGSSGYHIYNGYVPAKFVTAIVIG
jgi:hypothetical protein